VTAVLAVNLGAYVVAHERTPYNPRGPWKELAAFFGEVGRTRIETTGVLTPNPQAFQLITGYPAPMTIGTLNPLYDHVVVQLGGSRAGLSEAVAEVTMLPWVLYRLPVRQHGWELRDSIGPPSVAPRQSPRRPTASSTAAPTSSTTLVARPAR
jgi:hypothetical protein